MKNSNGIGIILGYAALTLRNPGVRQECPKSDAAIPRKSDNNMILNDQFQTSEVSLLLSFKLHWNVLFKPDDHSNINLGNLGKSDRFICDAVFHHYL